LGTRRVHNSAASFINRSHTRTDNQNLTNVFDNVTPAQNVSFWMSDANRLQNANGPWGAKTFYYDGVGNRTQEITTPTGGSTTTDVLGYPSTSNRVVQMIPQGDFQVVARGASTIRQMTGVYPRARGGQHWQPADRRAGHHVHLQQPQPHGVGDDWGHRLELHL
jgi:hypothetical protein